MGLHDITPLKKWKSNILKLCLSIQKYDEDSLLLESSAVTSV